MKRKLYGFTNFNSYACLTDSIEDAIIMWHSRLRSADIYSIEIDDAYLEKSNITLQTYSKTSLVRSLVSTMQYQSNYSDAFELRKCYRKTPDVKPIWNELIDLLSTDSKSEYSIYYLEIENKNITIEELKEKGNYEEIGSYKKCYNFVMKKFDDPYMFYGDELKQNEKLKRIDSYVTDILNPRGSFFSLIKVANPNVNFREYIKFIDEHFTFRKSRMR